MKRVTSLMALVMLGAVGTTAAQAQGAPPASSVITTSINAVSYQLGRDTKVDLKGTSAMPNARGEAKVDPKPGATRIDIEVKGLTQPAQISSEFLTYVLWAVSPEGRTSNLGEVQIDTDGNGKLTAGTPLQVFSLVVTAEPYFAARWPSEVVVLVNEIRKDTKGTVFVVKEYQLLKRNQYARVGNPLALALDLEKIPLEMYQARNAVDIARSRGADKYAADIYTKAEASLKTAEDALAKKADKKQIVSTARQAVQFSEDARALSVQKQDEERIVAERVAAASKATAEAEAKAATAASGARLLAESEAGRQAALATSRAAEAKLSAGVEATRQAELAAGREAQLRADAAAVQSKVLADASSLKAREAAAVQTVANLEREKAELRQRLLTQFRQVLDTTDTDRGLVVNLSDVLFDSGEFTLRPTAREKLARVAGIIVNYPKLMMEAEGHTDNTGSAAFNQGLSERRAEAVREFIVAQGVSANSISSAGMGLTTPVAGNDTSAGRQQNRRVELIVSGEVIGVKVGPTSNQP